MTRGVQSQFYDYNDAENMAQLYAMNGCDIMIMRTWMKPFFEGDLLMQFPDDVQYVDSYGEKQLIMPEVEYIKRIRYHMLRELSNSARWVSKYCSEFCKGTQVEDVLNAVLEKYEVALKKQRNIDSVARQRLSWFEKNAAGKPDTFWLNPGDDPEDVELARNYMKMQGREFQQYVWVKMMYDVYMPRLKKVMEMAIDFAESHGLKEESEKFRINEYNRLKRQTRHEQERKFR